MDKQRLLDMMRSGRVPHALLIAGPSGSGRKELARRAASVWCLGEEHVARLGDCANYQELTGGAVDVQAAREMIAQTAAQGFNGGRRAFLLLDAHRMSEQIQNVLLKTLEEPPEGTILILTGNEAGLLPTIRSRCAIFRLGHDAWDATAAALGTEGIAPQQAAAAARLADGVPGLAREMAGERGQTLLSGAEQTLGDALFGTLPFLSMTPLLQTPAPDGDTAEEDGKRKLNRDNALSVVLLWQTLLRDALVLCTGGAQPMAAEKAALTGRIAQSFTISEIQGMIKITVDAEKQLRRNTNPAYTLDAALVRLSNKEIKAWQE